MQGNSGFRRRLPLADDRGVAGPLSEFQQQHLRCFGAGAEVSEASLVEPADAIRQWLVPDGRKVGIVEGIDVPDDYS